MGGKKGSVHPAKQVERLMRRVMQRESILHLKWLDGFVKGSQTLDDKPNPKDDVLEVAMDLGVGYYRSLVECAAWVLEEDYGTEPDEAVELGITLAGAMQSQILKAFSVRLTDTDKRNFHWYFLAESEDDLLERVKKALRERKHR